MWFRESARSKQTSEDDSVVLRCSNVTGEKSASKSIINGNIVARVLYIKHLFFHVSLLFRDPGISSNLFSLTVRVCFQCLMLLKIVKPCCWLLFLFFCFDFSLIYGRIQCSDIQIVYLLLVERAREITSYADRRRRWRRIYVNSKIFGFVMPCLWCRYCVANCHYHRLHSSKLCYQQSTNKQGKYACMHWDYRWLISLTIAYRTPTNCIR